MAVEIERKYLVDKKLLPNLENGYKIKQGYITTEKIAVVRVRVKNDKAYLTIKGESSGISRLEFEYEIPLIDANEMLDKLCLESIIDKTRYLIEYKNHTWELDIFHGLNDGLIVAEVELNDENEDIELPNWIREEVSNDTRYYNSNLMSFPYSKWK